MAFYTTHVNDPLSAIARFEMLSLTQEEQRRPGSGHWHILAERR
jgi:hypothetical protein